MKSERNPQSPNTARSARKTLARAAARLGLAASIAAGIGAVEAGSASADSSNQVYAVNATTAAGGVYARSAPDSSATQHITGYGVWPNDTVQLICGVTDGTPVGPYNNTTWHYVEDLSNSGEGDFWINDHYLNTPNQPDQLAPGEAQCGENNQVMPGAAPASLRPWQLPTTSEHNYIASVQWVDTPSGESLHVFPTTKGRLLGWAASKSAFAEADRDANLAYSEGMYNQFACHADLAPPTKDSWNLDTWRPTESLIATIDDYCNPGGGNSVTNLLQYFS